MKKLLLFSVLLILFAKSAVSQIYREPDSSEALNGVVRERGTYIPVAGAKVAVKGTAAEIYTDARGFFVVPNVGKGGDTWLQISAEDYEMLEMPVTIGGIEELGVLFLDPKRRDVNPITVNDLRPSGSEVRSQTLSEVGASALLFGTGDILAEAANYNLGNLGFRMRGYEWKNTDVYFNGVPMNEEEYGYALPQLWNGLNDASSKAEGSLGINSSLLYMGNIGGVSNLRIRPSEFRQQFKASYAFGNSLYNHRAMLTYATGAMDNGWSFLISASYRLGNGFAEGMKYNGASYLVVAEKEIADNQTLMFTVVGAPTERGMQNYSVQKAYDEAGSNTYNSAWGNDKGDKRNARINNYHQPLISLSHTWNKNDWTLLRTTAGFTFGNNSETALNWAQDIADPRPDTYDKLGTAFTNTDNQQINWQDMRTANSGAQANYVLGKQNASRTTFTLNSIFDTELTDVLFTTAGVQARIYNGSFYNQVNDLLGAEYWTDIDKFTSADAAALPSPDFYQNDMNHPSRDVKTGDRFGYDYNISQMKFDLWSKWSYSWRYLDFTASGAVSYTSFNRSGNMQNGKFPDNSEGSASAQNFINFAVKGSVNYPLFASGRVEATLAFLTRAPQFYDAYLLPQVSNWVTPDLKSEMVIASELSYLMAGAFLNVRATLFTTQINKQTRVRHYYDNDYQSLFGMALSGFNQQHMGLELCVDTKLWPEVTLKTAGVYGAYKYTNNPAVTLVQQNNSKVWYDNVEAQMKDLHVSNAPQLAITAGLQYDATDKRWWIGGNVNYIGMTYSEINPVRLTADVIADIQSKSAFQSYLGQEKLGSGFTLDLHGGYTFELSKKYYLGLNVNAHNLLGSKDTRIGGYEPLGVFDTSRSADKYAASYAYAYGRTIFLIASFRF